VLRGLGTGGPAGWGRAQARRRLRSDACWSRDGMAPPLLSRSQRHRRPVSRRGTTPSGVGWRHDTLFIAAGPTPLRAPAGECPSTSVAVMSRRDSFHKSPKWVPRAIVRDGKTAPPRTGGALDACDGLPLAQLRERVKRRGVDVPASVRSTATPDGAIRRCGTLRPPSRLQPAHRAELPSRPTNTCSPADPPGG
jgi:hypothetical protein